LPFQPVVQKIYKDLLSSSRYWPFILTQSAAFAYLSCVLILTNSYGFFAFRKLILAAAFLPVFLALTAFLYGHFLVPRLKVLSRRGWIGLIAISLGLAGIGFLIFPAPRAGLAQPHHLRIQVAPNRNPESKGGVIEIQRIRSLDGQRIAAERFRLDGDWQVIEGSLYSTGKTGAAVTLDADIIGGIALGFKYQADAGEVNIFWDGQTRSVDLYAPDASVSDIVIRMDEGASLPLSKRLVDLATNLLFSLGLFCAAFTACLFLRLNLLHPRWVFVALAYVGILGLFVFLKLDYPTFIAERVFRDTSSYLVQAEIPLTSLSFWAGERSFTLPLLFKILHLQRDVVVMSRVFQFQLWFAILSWAALAAAAASSLRNKWLGPFAFGLVLLFGTNLETGLWDSLLLTESLSISLFVLLLAMWIGWFHIESIRPRLPRALYVCGMVLVSVLYAFTRDSNLYFLLACSVVFILAQIIQKLTKNLWIYAAAMLLLAVLHTASLSGGNRWQIFIYDHLAVRILPNPTATAYFANAGLPVTPQLRQITGMIGYEYHDLLINSPSMQPVRDWVNLKGKNVYIAYLLSRPLQTLLEPLQQFDRLANGSNLVYLYPRFLPLSIPERVTWITNLFYSHSAVSLAGLFLLGAAACMLFWTGPLKRSGLALTIFALLISIYPMMFIIWHGEPLEIERHAVQIGIQWRLAGWLALPLLVDSALQWVTFRRWLDLPAASSSIAN
jgi:hypothetical protein